MLVFEYSPLHFASIRENCLDLIAHSKRQGDPHGGSLVQFQPNTIEKLHFSDERTIEVQLYLVLLRVSWMLKRCFTIALQCVTLLLHLRWNFMAELQTAGIWQQLQEVQRFGFYASCYLHIKALINQSIMTLTLQRHQRLW